MASILTGISIIRKNTLPESPINVDTNILKIPLSSSLNGILFVRKDTSNYPTNTDPALFRYPIDSVLLGGVAVGSQVVFFRNEILTEISPGAGLRDNGDRVRFPYDQFTAATSIDKGTYLSFSDVAALASNPRVQVIYDGPAAIIGIIVDSIYEIDCE